MAAGAMKMGKDEGMPRIVVVVSTFLTSRNLHNPGPRERESERWLTKGDVHSRTEPIASERGFVLVRTCVAIFSK
jgi:hypothetical protein